jgi:hypothetical protein
MDESAVRRATGGLMRRRVGDWRLKKEILEIGKDLKNLD